jgi:hypothetical protein
LDYGRPTTFTVSLEGITDTQAAGTHARNTTRLYCTFATNNPLKKAHDPQCPSPTRRPFRESALVDKIMRNYKVLLTPGIIFGRFKIGVDTPTRPINLIFGAGYQFSVTSNPVTANNWVATTRITF